MEIDCTSPADAFIEASEILLKERVVYCLNIKFDAIMSEKENLLFEIFDRVFLGKFKFKGGIKLNWREWLINSGFPMILYERNGSSIKNMLKDYRLTENNPASKMSFHSFFGRLCRPLYGDSKMIFDDDKKYSFIEYLIERWSKKISNAPFYYFDVERAEYVWEEMIKNKTQVRTSRGANTCAMNMFFQGTNDNNFIVGWILKFAYYSHLINDIISPVNIAIALNKEISANAKPKCDVFIVKASLDDKVKCKKIIEEYREKYPK